MSSLDHFDRQNQKGVFKLLAQKISQKLDSLAEISNIQERWVWQLIQNAKDAGNEFDKIKIKIQIHDDHLSFAHNGSLITPQDLNSIINQYSVKEEENKEDIQTTGKYGTGFITTYILSKKIRLECRCLNVPADSASESQEQIIKEQLNNKLTEPKANTKSTKPKKLITNKQKMKEQKIKEKLADLKYQDLNVNLNRQHNNMEELIKKLEKSKKELRKQLETSKLIKYSERSEDSFDTKFIFEDLDQNSFSIIEKGIESIFYLFPYALLFNPKISSIQIKNLSAKTKIKNTIIERQQTKSIFGLYKIFNVEICEFEIKQGGMFSRLFSKEAENNKIIKSYLYFQYKESSSIVAFPVQLNNNKISLLKFDSKYPKIFKQFPLIGSRDIEFNFAFTSKEFYPAQTRKELLLKKCYGRQTHKTIKNWEILNNIFTSLQSSLILFINKLSRGKFNLFIIPEPKTHLFCEKEMQSYKFQDLIKAYSKTIFQSKMFASRNFQKDKKLFSITEISIPFHKHNKQISLEMNRLFSILFDNKTLDLQEHAQLMQALQLKNNHKYHKLEASLKFIKIDNCIKALEKVGYAGFINLFQNTDEALNHLTKIYSFLLNNFTNLILSQNYKITLTQENKFQAYFQKDKEENLKLDANFVNKQKYISLFQKMNINWKKKTIHKQFTYIFKEPALKIILQTYDYSIKQKQSKIAHKQRLQKQQQEQLFLNVSWCLKYISDEFNLQGVISQEQRMEQLLKMGKCLFSFKTQTTQPMQFASKMKGLKQIRNSFIYQKIEEIPYKYFIQKLKNLFSSRWQQLIGHIYNKSPKMEAFTNYFVQNDEQVSFSLINYVISLSHKEHKCILRYPNALGDLLNENQIKMFQPYETSLTEEDQQIYQLHKKYNLDKSLVSQIKSLQKLFLHPKIEIPKKIIKKQIIKIATIKYGQLFNFLNYFYNDKKIQKSDKKKILQYCLYIYEGHKRKPQQFKHKYSIFKEIIDNRHVQYSKYFDDLSDQEKDLFTKILNKRQYLKQFSELIQNYDIKYTLTIMKQLAKQQ